MPEQDGKDTSSQQRDEQSDDLLALFPLEPPVVITHGQDGGENWSIALANIDGTYAKFPTMIPALPPVYFAPIGMIIVQWGEFEQLHDEVLKKVIAYNATNLTLPRGFKGRARLFRKELIKALPEKGELYNAIEGALTKASELYWKRNVLAHGQLQLQVKINKQAEEVLAKNHFVFSVYGQGEDNGVSLVADFTMQDLRTVFYSFAHLAGVMHEVAQPDCQLPHSSSQEKSFLQAVRGRDCSNVLN